MSVLIKGMEMPEDCFLCPCIEYEHHGYVCWITGYQAHHNERPIGCPFVEVPPHGRLIDADALLDLLNNCVFPSDMVTTTAVRMAMNWIKDSPTVIEVEDGE